MFHHGDSPDASSPPEYAILDLSILGESEPVEIEIIENDKFRVEDLTQAYRRREQREVARFDPVSFSTYSRRPAVARPTLGRSRERRPGSCRPSGSRRTRSGSSRSR